MRTTILLFLAALAAAGQTTVISPFGTGNGGSSVTAGPSGAITVTNGQVDVAPSIVPLLSNSNTFTGTQTFGNIAINGTCTGSGCASGGSGIASGTLAAIPATCTVGSSYLATNLSVTQQLFLCTATNTWTQFLVAGTSGAIAITNGVIDVVPGVLAQLNLGNAFTGSNSFGGTTTFNNVAINGSCTGTGCNTGSKGRTCELHIWGSGASSALTTTTDNEPYSCMNDTVNTFTITSVKCLADNSSTTTTVTPAVQGGSNILSPAALTCGNGTFAAGSLSGTPTLASGASINAQISAGGTAKSIRLIITGTY